MDRNFAKCEFRTTWCEILFREIFSANFAKPKNWHFLGFPHSFLQFFGKLPNRIQIYSIIQYRIIELSKKSCIIMDLPLVIPIIMKSNHNLIKNWDDVWKINKLVHFSPSLTENTQKLLKCMMLWLRVFRSSNYISNYQGRHSNQCHRAMALVTFLVSKYQKSRKSRFFLIS